MVVEGVSIKNLVTRQDLGVSHLAMQYVTDSMACVY